MDISVEHPTDRPNFYIVNTPKGRFAFSYRTLIAVYPYASTVLVEEKASADRITYQGYRWYVSNNEWSQTTGKHLNWIDEDKSDRLPSSSIEAIVNGLY